MQIRLFVMMIIYPLTGAELGTLVVPELGTAGSFITSQKVFKSGRKYS